MPSMRSSLAQVDVDRAAPFQARLGLIQRPRDGGGVGQVERAGRRHSSAAAFALSVHADAHGTDSRRFISERQAWARGRNPAAAP